MRLAGWWMVLAALGVAAAGCGQPTPRAKELRSVSAVPPKPVDVADAVDFWAAPPAAINWDEVPGPDGIQARLFLFQVNRPEPVLVTGTIEFLMYAGRAERGAVVPGEPLKTWRFTGDELVGLRVRDMVGWGYATRLGWDGDVPKGPVVTFRVRYQPPQGPPVYSAPMSIALPEGVRTGPVKSVIRQPAEGKPGA